MIPSCLPRRSKKLFGRVSFYQTKSQSQQLDCPEHLHQFAIDPEMRKSLGADYDILVTFSEGDKLTVTGPGKFRETVESTIVGKIQVYPIQCS